MKKAKNINGTVKIYYSIESIPNFDKEKRTIGIKANDLESYGYFDVIDNPITENQEYGTLLPDHLVGNKYITPIIDIPEPTAQQLYDNLVEEGKQVFDEFSIELSKAAIPYNILNNHPEELKELTRQLLAVKEEIKTGLKYYLDNNMIAELKAFNYNDERAEMLREAINNFK